MISKEVALVLAAEPEGSHGGSDFFTRLFPGKKFDSDPPDMLQRISFLFMLCRVGFSCLHPRSQQNTHLISCPMRAKNFKVGILFLEC